MAGSKRLHQGKDPLIQEEEGRSLWSIQMLPFVGGEDFNSSADPFAFHSRRNTHRSIVD